MSKTTVVAAAVAVALVFGAGWVGRGVVADRDMLAYQQSQQATQDKGKETLREEVAAVEAKDEANTQASTDRLNVQEPKRESEVRYVTKEIIRYKDRPVAGKCVLPAEWVRIYNATGGATGTDSGMPEASAARSSAAGNSSRF